MKVKKQQLGFFFIVLACLAWALDTLIRYPLVNKGISVVGIVSWEHFFLCLFFFPFFIKLVKKCDLKSWLVFLLIGGGGSALATLLLTKAFTMTNPSAVILMQKVQPVFAILLAWTILKEPIHSRFLLWAAGGILGGILIAFNDNTIAAGELFSLGRAHTGYLYALAAAVLWGASTVFGRLLAKRGFKASEITAGRVYIGFLTLLPFAILDNGSIQQVYDRELGAVFIMVLLAGVLGLSLYYKGLLKTPARLATVAELSFPLWVVLLNFIIHGVVLNIWQLGGASLLVFCMFMLQREKLA